MPAIQRRARKTLKALAAEVTNPVPTVPEIPPFLQETRTGIVRAFDMEATGLDLWHGCLPFSMQLCGSDGQVYFAEWDVEPFTRIPTIDADDLYKVISILDSSSEVILHNPKIDIRALRVACEHIRLNFDIQGFIRRLWPKIRDTLTKSHALRNLWSHTLKDLRDVFLHVSKKKQNRLKEATNEARSICKSKAFKKKYGEWRIADIGDPHWPGVRKEPKEKEEDVEGWWLYDTWLPKTIWRLAPDFLPPEDGDMIEAIDKEGKSLGNGGPHYQHTWKTVLKDYAIEDVETTLVLNEVLDDALKKEGLTAVSDRRHRAIEISYAMEEWGVSISLDKIESEQKRYRGVAAENEKIVKDLAAAEGLVDFNPESHPQIRQLLYEKWGLPALKTTEPSKKFPQGQASTDADTLTDLLKMLSSTNEHQYFGHDVPIVNCTKFIESHLERSQNAKAAEDLDNYRRWSVNHGPAWGVRLHSNFNTTGTRFTRWSSSNHNLQNVGTGDDAYDEKGEKYTDFLTRLIFKPRPGYEWLSMDFQSIEYFIWGWSCGNQEIRRVYEAGDSPFKPIMEAVRGYYNPDDKVPYKKTKNGMYSIIYGSGEAHSDDTFGVPGAVRKVIDRVPEVRTFTNQLHKIVKEKGYITTLGGYRLYVPLDEPHKATSAFVQGHAGWVIMEAMIDCYNYLKFFPDISMILQIHDELIFEGPIGFADDHGDILAGFMRRSGEKYGIPTPVNRKLIRYPLSWGEAIAI